ncbi:MAG TPA: VOC family protein [Microlunatus sp.]|nr:VOC family protein [Microlunatus sp.]
MRTLFPGLRVSEVDRSQAFYTALGYVEAGRVVAGDATLVMLRFPGESEVTLELVHRPAEPVRSGGIDHLAIQVDDLVAGRAAAVAAGLNPGEIEFPGGPDGPRISRLADPDGNPVELVEWPAGHPTGMTDADFR